MVVLTGHCLLRIAKSVRVVMRDNCSCWSCPFKVYSECY